MTEQEKRERIAKALKENRIADVEDAVNFVRDLLEIEIEETEQNEPYATNFIEEARIALDVVGHLV